jgi:hypothetical protein
MAHEIAGHCYLGGFAAGPPTDESSVGQLVSCKRWRVLAAVQLTTPIFRTLPVVNPSRSIFLYPAIGDEPNYRDERVDRNRQPGIEKSQRNSGSVKVSVKASL